MPKLTVFKREATGLVREASGFDAILFNLAASGPVGFALAWSMAWVLYVAPGNNFILSMIMGLGISLVICASVAFLTSAMPRSGGDYVFVSRIVNPTIGFASNLALVIPQFIFAALTAYWFSTLTLGPSLAVLGQVTHGGVWTKMAEVVVTPTGSLILGLVAITVVAASLASGLKTALKFNNVLMLVGLFSLIPVVLVLLTTSQTTFISRFNDFAQQFTGQANSYSFLLEAAKSGGLALPSYHPWDKTVLAVSPAVGLLAWTWFSTYMSGEIKGSMSMKRQLTLMLAPAILNAALMILIIYLLFNRVGYNFLASLQYLHDVTPAAYPLPVAPFFNLFVGIISGNPILNVLLAIGFIAWPLPLMVVMFTMLTRAVFAWAFDGLVPYKLADVSERFHSPVVAITIVSLVSAALLVLTIYGGSIIYTWMALSNMFVYTGFFLVGLTGLLFPFLKKDLYRTSPAKIEVFGVPLVSILGGLMAIFSAWLWSLYFMHGEFGLARWSTVYPPVATLVFAFVYYRIVVAVRRKQGVDLTLVYDEIPPE